MSTADRETPCEEEGGDQGDASTRQVGPQQQGERQGAGCPSQPSEGTYPADTLTYGLQIAVLRQYGVVFEPVCGPWFQQSQQTDSLRNPATEEVIVFRNSFALKQLRIFLVSEK